jgi:predicted dehydrogenase
MTDVSRRSFLQTGLAAGAVLAAPGIAHGQAEPAPVRVGMVGVGNRGTFLVRTLLSIPGVQINAIADINEQHATRAQKLVEDATGNAPAIYTKGERDYENLVTRDDLDAVITATPWEWHTPVMIAAMQAGKYGGTEVPAALTLEECWDLVKTSESTGMPCMMLENVCYFQNVLTVLRMVREGVLGDILHCEAGYQHDTRYTKLSADGKLTWRAHHVLARDGSQYPTHPIGPVAWYMNINRGDRFDYLVSMSTPAIGLKHYLAEKLGPDHEFTRLPFVQGDVNTTLIKTVKGNTITLYYDSCTPRPYDLILRVQGTKGMYMGTTDGVYIEGVSPKPHAYEPFAPYLEKYAHPLWASLEEEALKNGGHGGGDYITMWEFVQAVRDKRQTPQDVYDAAAWSVIVPLSVESVASRSAPIAFPDFTQGKWEITPPVT